MKLDISQKYLLFELVKVGVLSTFKAFNEPINIQ